MILKPKMYIVKNLHLNKSTVSFISFLKSEKIKLTFYITIYNTMIENSFIHVCRQLQNCFLSHNIYYNTSSRQSH